MGIDLYYSPGSSGCWAVITTAKYLEIPLNLKTVNLIEGDHLKPEFLEINPQHCIPTMVEDEFVLWESRAIMRYLVNQYSSENQIYPTDVKQRAIVDRLLDFDLGTLNSAIGQYFAPQLMKGEEPNPEKEAEMRNKLALLEIFLSEGPYAAGDSLTLADFSLLSSVSILEAFDFDLSMYS
ncbi:glutathione S-transferase 1: isoform D-like protein, partial [Dinothrombium tinctorium]